MALRVKSSFCLSYNEKCILTLHRKKFTSGVIDILILPQAEEGEDEEDIADSVQREVQQLQAANKTSQPRFRVLNSGAKNCVFISSTVPDPGLLVHRLLSDLKASQRQRARFMNRLLPVEVTCRATLDDITQAASKLFDKYFSEGNKSFAIIYNDVTSFHCCWRLTDKTKPARYLHANVDRCRNNSSLQRDALIEALADLVKLKNASNSANLTSPDLAVLVEVLRTTCCLAVVTDYFTLAKYNVIEVAGKPVAAAAGDAEEDGAASSLLEEEVAEPSGEDQKTCNSKTNSNPTTVNPLPPSEPVASTETAEIASPTIESAVSPEA
ncbi:hypothetical protein B566_EDAN010114 [Ephemera danica]|nr:hypothetical protein B566_EDAN010114 [Ephemera danica]